MLMRAGALLLCALLASSCGGGGGGNSAVPGPPAVPPPPPPPAGVIERDSLSIPEGAEEHITADRLIVRNGARIDGTLIIDAGSPTGADAFQLIVQSGDLVVNGMIAIGPLEWVEPPEPVAAGRVQIAAARAQAAETPCELARPVRGGGPARHLVLQSESGDIRLGAFSCYAANSGTDAATLIVTEPGNGHAVLAPNGGRGGDIVLVARTVHVERAVVADPLNASALRGPFFVIGDGGAGGSIEIDDAAFPNELPQRLHFIAGDGGRSGQLRITGEIEVHPVLGTMTDAYGWRLTPTALGTGGAGGDVVWHVGADHEFSGLQEIALQSGYGGDGAAAGGEGGLVDYDSGRVINSPSMPRATAINVLAGNGGDAEAAFLNGGESSPVRIYVAGHLTESFSARGGAGGPVRVRGNSGTGADPTQNPDGQPGGNITVNYGRGGDAKSTHVYPWGRGGPGGGLYEPPLSERIVDPGNFVAPILVPRGGNGASFCGAQNDRTGGRGGDTGSLTLYLGRGGDGAIPGNGGVLDYDWIEFSPPGQGGDGDPPGENGEEGDVILNVASGGEHPEDPTVAGEGTVVRGTRIEVAFNEPASCGGEPEPLPEPALTPLTEIDDKRTEWVTGLSSSTHTETTYTKGLRLPDSPDVAMVNISQRIEIVSANGDTTTSDGTTTCVDAVRAVTTGSVTRCSQGVCETEGSSGETRCRLANVFIPLRGRYDPPQCILVSDNDGRRLVPVASNGSTFTWEARLPGRTETYQYTCRGSCGVPANADLTCSDIPPR